MRCRRGSRRSRGQGFGPSANRFLVLGMGVALLSGCTNSGSVTGDRSLAVDRIEVFPKDMVVYAGEETEPIQFSATVFWNTGDVTEDAPVAWSSSNQVAGEMTWDGLFTPATSNGGITQITASYLGVRAYTTLTVVFTQDIVTDGLPETLPQQYEQATIVEDDDLAPLVIYPYDGVVVPRNIHELPIHWNTVEDRPLTVLELDSVTTRTRVFTLSDRWTPDQSQWQAIAATNSGGSFTITALSGVLEGEGAEVRLGGDLAMHSHVVEVSISRLDATGSIYYWSSSNMGIMRIAHDGDRAVDYFTPSSGGDNCVSCHSLSPSGTRMGVGYFGTGSNRQGLLEIHAEGPPTELRDYDTAILATYTTTTPDEKYTVGVDGGHLSLYDGQTWDYIGPIDIGFETVANPKFSPDGEEMVFSVIDPDKFNSDMHFFEGRIAAAPFDSETGTFGEPYWVTPRVEGANQYYPVYSPDGNWIAYNQSTPTSPDANDADSLMDGTAEVYLVARGGGSPPIRLDNLNDVAREFLGTIDEDILIDDGEVVEPTPVGPPPDESELPPPMLANSWPGWGPLPDADLLWLTFSSLRGFGHDVPFGNPQIWVSAIDPEKAEAGVDPSSPPFWLPLQDPTTNNHIPQWGPL